MERQEPVRDEIAAPNSFDRRELLRRVGFGTGAIALGTAFGLPAAFGTPPQVAAQDAPGGGTLIEGSALTIEALAPLVDANRATLFLFDTLVSTNAETLEPQPNLAASWEFAPAELTYTFKLQNGVTFHDGQPLTADDVKFTLDLLLNEATASPYYSIFADRIASVAAPDPATVVVTLKRPIATFLNDLSAYSIGILPKHLLADVKPEDLKASEFATAKPVGTGPFKLKEYRPGEAVLLEANPDYHRGAPKIGEYVLKIVRDSTVAYQQLKTGEVDVAPIGADFYEDAQAQDAFTPVVIDTFALNILGFNLDPATGPAALQDLKVRQAIAHAIDRQLIVDRIYAGLGTVAVGTEPPPSGANAPDQIKVTYDYDPAKAASLLDEAGWVAGSGGTRAKDGQKLALTALGNATRKADEGALLAIQEFLAAVGIELTPQLEADAFWDKLLSHDFQVALVNFTFPADPDQSLAWASDSTFNAWSYKSEAVDDLLKRGLETQDPEARTPIYIEMQNILLADLPGYVLHFDQRVTGVSNRVQNYKPSAVGYYWAVHYDAPTWTVTGA
ncbi:MAG TPA: ABC transporter substrate-binding protein [Thermomicrobiales bacterium]|nr:ABC transporter substrate-binding protein [Thermomicrobiales bacterium]